MVKYYVLISLSLVFFCNSSFAQTSAESQRKSEIFERPLMERYVLDELKALRNEQNQFRVEVTEKIVSSKLENSDRALRYTADTTNNIFYIITAAASLLVLLGWKSINDIKYNIESVTSEKISKLIANYEERLEEVEDSVKIRSDQLLATQEEISNTNKLHSLWMRSAIEKNIEEKISLYDEILEMQPDDVEALTYKADALLDTGESKWALSLTDQAIEQDSGYSIAYWQRACAKADLGEFSDALEDLDKFINISSITKEELDQEPFFNELRKDKRYIKMISKYI